MTSTGPVPSAPAKPFGPRAPGAPFGPCSPPEPSGPRPACAQPPIACAPATPVSTIAAQATTPLNVGRRTRLRMRSTFAQASAARIRSYPDHWSGLDLDQALVLGQVLSGLLGGEPRARLE